MASKSFSLIRKNKGKKNDGSSSPTKANSAGTAKETAPAAAKGSTIKVNVDQAALNAARSLIGSIDQGTSSSRFLIFSEKGRIVASAQRETTQYYPRPGWHEHDPMEIWLSVVQCVEAISAKTTNKALTTLQAIGITNQRETTVAWNNVTGLPYHNAIVWDDLRTSSIAQEVSNQEEIRKRTGLPVASYFAGTKVKWLMDNVPQLQKDLQDKPHEVCFGTVDTWLTYQLTGQKAVQGSSSSNQGGLFVTDATNASRWLFMDLTSQKWDKELVQMVTGGSINLPLSCLPSIHPSSHLFGRCSNISTVPKILHNVPLAAILGDQQAALFGQTCFQPGEAKVRKHILWVGCILLYMFS
jgi:glycerol kinase